MEWLPTTFAMILGILLRVAVPVLVTLLFITLLKWLDERWKQEADPGAEQLVKVGNVGCWEINNCPKEKLAECKAYQNSNTPCWQVFRKKNGRLQERCIGCEVFRHAPMPVTT
jgi:hypothetical protein